MHVLTLHDFPWLPARWMMPWRCNDGFNSANESMGVS